MWLRRIEDSSTPTHLQIDMPSVMRMSPMETRHARKDRRHDHTITIVYNHVSISITYIPGRKRRPAFIPGLNSRISFFFLLLISYDNIINATAWKFPNTSIRQIYYISMVIHETHLTKSRTTLSLWLSRVSLLRPLSPFFLVSFLFLSTKATLSDLSLPLELLWQQLGNLIHLFLLASLKKSSVNSIATM